MSTCVNIRTKKRLSPDEIFHYMVERGEKIVVTQNEFPCLKFGTQYEATRGIEINQEEDGYEIRICSLSSAGDYKLFANTILYLEHQTGGRAFLENDEEEEISDPLNYFNKEWIDEQVKHDFEITRTLIAYGSEMVFFGLFLKFCIGPKILEGFDIPLHGDYNHDSASQLADYLCNMQWHFANLTDTGTQLGLPSSTGDETKALTMSIISIKDGKVCDFDYVSYADLLVIMDMDHQRCPTIIPFREAWKILPPEVFSKIDEWQFARNGELSIEQVHEIMERGHHLMPKSYFYKPTYPGNGYDKEQNTIILMWNPAISSVTLKEHCDNVGKMLTQYFNWSVFEHEKAKCGDRFFLVRVGEGKTGIVMSGVFDSQPYEAGDWSKKGRRIFYMDMIPNVILDPENAPMVTTGQLSELIPSFDWTGGHSGRILNPHDARNLEKLWHKYIKEKQDNIDGITLNMNRSKIE